MAVGDQRAGGDRLDNPAAFWHDFGHGVGAESRNPGGGHEVVRQTLDGDAGG
ncbi:hypothetical protein [Bauldia litoralis]|uniref:Uncharacterized protein n=1 Tax=Bauldia litoralis TaxID=665467 RepID=A0A1G6B6N0_9HYPH|nr:hypothetical protein [Bauldia litoralis]SDB16305.1 hypothetical protein SAMN02982931_01293 [Bauldia litoralis]